MELNRYGGKDAAAVGERSSRLCVYIRIYIYTSVMRAAGFFSPQARPRQGEPKLGVSDRRCRCRCQVFDFRQFLFLYFNCVCVYIYIYK